MHFSIQKVTALSWLRFGRRPALLDTLLLFGCTVGTVLATEVWSVPDSADREIVGLATGILVAILNADAVLIVTTELQVTKYGSSQVLSVRSSSIRLFVVFWSLCKFVRKHIN